MNLLKDFRRKNFRINSVDVCEIVNMFRSEQGNESVLRHSDFMRNTRNEITALRNIDDLNFEDVSEVAELNFELGSEIDERKIAFTSEVDIEKYIAENFIESTYTDKQNREKPCFLFTRQGAMQMLNRESAYVRMKTQMYIAELEQQLKDSELVRERKISAITHDDLHELIDDDKKCMGLDKEIYRIVSYKLGLDFIYRKESMYRLDKENISFYDKVLSTAYDLLEMFKRRSKDGHFVGDVREELLYQFIGEENMNEYNEYVRTHEVMTEEDELNTLLFGFGDNARRVRY